MTDDNPFTSLDADSTSEHRPDTFEQEVYEFIHDEATDSESGLVAWETIVDEFEEQGHDAEEVENAVTSLMDVGRVFEPILGKLKPT